MEKVKDGRRKGKEEKRKGGGSSSIMKLARLWKQHSKITNLI